MALRRQVKNVVKNFSDIEVKVREATSNDPWGPSSSLTSEIADATYNVQAFTEIMTLLWKRINDHGKNWRHVYKSLVVLEYIVKTGSERVAQQCKENIFAIKTLKDFQFIDKDGKDQGVNIREKSKALVALVKDEERLKAERQRALKAKERFSQSQGGIGNTNYPKNRKYQPGEKYPEARGSMDDSSIPTRTPNLAAAERDADSRSTDGRIDSDIEKVRPSNEAEEEMQLQIALAMSREEAEQDQKTKDIETKLFNNLGGQQPLQQPQPQASTLLNLTDLGTALPPPSDPWGQPAQASSSNANDPWSMSAPSQPSQLAYSTAPAPAADPWGSAPVSQPPPDPWGGSAPAPAPTVPQTSNSDPWGSASGPSQPVVDPFAPAPSSSSSISTSMYNPPAYNAAPLQPQGGASVDPFDSFGASSTQSLPQAGTGGSFLSNGSHLVDVDNIMATPGETKPAANPFMSTSNTNPFLQDKPKPKSMNELKVEKNNAFVQPSAGGTLLPTPMQPAQSNNPFL